MSAGVHHTAQFYAHFHNVHKINSLYGCRVYQLPDGFVNTDDKINYNAYILGYLLSTPKKNGPDLVVLRSNYIQRSPCHNRDIYPTVGRDFKLLVTGHQSVSSVISRSFTIVSTSRPPFKSATTKTLLQCREQTVHRSWPISTHMTPITVGIAVTKYTRHEKLFSEGITTLYM